MVPLLLKILDHLLEHFDVVHAFRKGSDLIPTYCRYAQLHIDIYLLLLNHEVIIKFLVQKL